MPKHISTPKTKLEFFTEKTSTKTHSSSKTNFNFEDKSQIPKIKPAVPNESLSSKTKLKFEKTKKQKHDCQNKSELEKMN